MNRALPWLALSPPAPATAACCAAGKRVKHKGETFEGLSSTQKTLGGFGNVEDNLLSLPGGAYRAVAVRSFDAKSNTWSIWWLDGRSPGVLDVPVVGRFEGGVGTFLARDTLNGRAIDIRFIWRPGERPRWEQAFSADGGKTWETNWVMDFTRPDAGAAAP